MPKSTRSKSHKLSKHSLKDYSGSEEDAKMKEKSSKDGNPVKSHRDSVAGEKRKISSEVREGKDSRDLSGTNGNGEVSHDYVSSKRRKEKADVSVGNDRWNGGGEDRGHSEQNGEKETNQGNLLKTDSKLKENSGKGESLRIESKNKSKRHESGSEIVRNEDYLASMVVDKEESKSKGESKRKPERDISGRKEGKELKDKDRRSEKDGGLEYKHGGDEAKLIVKDNGKKQMSQSGLFSERQGKHCQENTEWTVQDEILNSELERESEKKIRRRKEGSSGRDKHSDDLKSGEGRSLSSRGDHVEDKKYKDDKQKVENHAGRCQEDARKDGKQWDGKYRKEADKDDYHWDSRYREDGEKDAKHRDDKNREGDRDNRQKDEKHHENGERVSRRKDDKYREGTERDRRDSKYHDRDIRQKDDRYHEDGAKDFRSGKERYHEDGDRDGIRRVNSYREDGDKDNRQKNIKYREDSEQDIQHKDRKVVDDLDTEKRIKDTKYWDEHIYRDRSGYKSDHKRPKDDNYIADHHSRKSSAYDDIPVHDDRTSRYRDDQGRRRATEKEYYSDPRSQSIKDQRSSYEKKHANSARMDPVADTGTSTSRNADVELTSNHSRRRSSPTLSSHAARDHFRGPKQDESKYRDYNYEDRARPNISATKDYAGAFRGSEKSSSSRSLEKPSQKGDGRVGELSTERHMKNDSRSSPLQHVDKSPSPSTDRRQFSRSGVRRSIDVEESTYRSGSSRDLKDYSGKEGRGTQEFAVDVLPEDEFSKADADTLSVSSPFMRNSHFNSSSKSLLHPPSSRTGMDSPLPLGLAESDSRGKSNSRHRRTGDPNMGRIQQNAWRGVPSWPSPMANGFLPLPHATPPVGFHSVMQPFPAPPMFGVRPSMELNHPSPYHMSNADRFSGPSHPMGWRNPVDDSGSSFTGWDTGNAVFGDEAHIYGQPNWDHSRYLLGGRGWEASGDLWKGTASFDMGSSEKENNLARSADEALTGQSTQLAQNEQILVDQQVESAAIGQLTKSIEKNVGAPLISLEETGDVATMLRNDDARLSCVYLSKLDVSADLAEPELFNECTGLVNLDHSMLVDVEDFKILYLEENAEAKVGSHEILSHALFPSADDSVFQKAISIYKRQNESFRGEVGEKLKVLGESTSNSNQEDLNIEDKKSEKLCQTEDMQGVEDALPNIDIELDNQKNSPTFEEFVETSQEKIDPPVIDDLTEKPEETISATGVESALHLGMQENDVEEKPLTAESVGISDTLLPLKEKDVATEIINNNDEVKLLDTRYDPLMLNSDVSSEVEAMTRESLMSGSVNLSRIHHSHESTH